MTFNLYTDDGRVFGPYGSLPLAQKQARAKLAENTRRKIVEIRPVFAGKGAFSRHTVGSIYRSREQKEKS